MRRLVNIFGLILTWAIWLGLISLMADPGFSPRLLGGLALGGGLAIIPLVFAGRWLLDRQPTPERAVWVTTAVHYLVGICLGSSLIAATHYGLTFSTNPSTSGSSLTRLIGLGLLLLAGLAFIAVVVNLVLKGLGLPFAIALTQTVATDWIYAWTRNPMVLSALAFLVGLGLWLRSGLFLVWVLTVVSPALLVFLRVYEERELEIRFGAEYQDYKAHTPMLFPRPPRNRDSGGTPA